MAEDAVKDYLAKLGRKGAKATNSKLTKEQRQDSARKAAKARWGCVSSSNAKGVNSVAAQIDESSALGFQQGEESKEALRGSGTND